MGGKANCMTCNPQREKASHRSLLFPLHALKCPISTPMAPAAVGAPAAAAQNDRAVTLLHNISQILDTGLDKETLRLLVGLVEAGVNPEALALIVKELRRAGAEAAAASAPAHSTQ